MSIEDDFHSDNLLGDPDDFGREETEGPLFFDDEAGEENDVENNDESKTQSRNIVKPKKIVKNPQPKLDAERLKGPRGLAVLENVFKDYQFCGKGHEKRDLDEVMKRLEHWAHRLFPKYEFDDCLEKIESLGHKKPVMTYIKKLRMGLETYESSIVEPEQESNHVDDEDMSVPSDPFDELLSQQISVAHSSRNTTPQTKTNVMGTPKIVLTEEQKQRMERNRQLALERRMARLKAAQEHQTEAASNSLSDGCRGDDPTIKEHKNIPDDDKGSQTANKTTLLSEEVTGNEENSQDKEQHPAPPILTSNCTDDPIPVEKIGSTAESNGQEVREVNSKLDDMENNFGEEYPASLHIDKIQSCSQDDAEKQVNRDVLNTVHPQSPSNCIRLSSAFEEESSHQEMLEVNGKSYEKENNLGKENSVVSHMDSSFGDKAIDCNMETENISNSESVMQQITGNENTLIDDKRDLLN